MNEENKNITPEEGVSSAPEEPAAEEVFQTRIPRSKRTALIRYMAVLFAAAFVLHAPRIFDLGDYLHKYNPFFFLVYSG